MCMPVLNSNGDVVGVAQCINKITGHDGFTKQDQEVFRKYLTFAGIGIQNAQLFELSVQEYKRNQVRRSHHDSSTHATILPSLFLAKMWGERTCEVTLDLFIPPKNI